MEKSRKKSVERMVVIAMMSAVAFILMFFEFPLSFIAPPFYKLDFSDVPALIGGFALGPLAGVTIEFIKNLLNIIVQGTITGGIGELANFITGCALILPAAFIYKYKKSLKGAIIGLITGAVVLATVGSLINFFVMIPMYSAAMPDVGMDGIIAMGTAIVPFISDLKTFVLFAVAPFNLLKGIICSVLTFLLYKRVSPVLRKF